MKENIIKRMYNLSWKNKNDSDFNFYERNWHLKDFFVETGKVLDVACGSGTVGIWLQKRGFEVTGIDISEVALAMAKKKGLKNVTCGNVEEGLPFGNKTFDYVFCGDIIEHLLNPPGLLKEARRVLKDDGVLVLSCPNLGYLYYRLSYLKTGKVPLSEGIYRPPWKWEHIRFFNKESLLQLLGEAGFTVYQLVGASKRSIDRLLNRFSPGLFGSVFVVGAKKAR